MSDLQEAQAQVDGWLQPLPDDAAPTGPDLEYDNDFLALTLAVAGKPESQFGGAEPPDWRAAAEMAAQLLGRTRDLRVALDWLRASLHLSGYAALPLGLRLLGGMVDTMWEHLHPLPDPDDGDPYARVNALNLLREHAGLLGDLRQARITDDRSIGLLLVSDIEAALGLPSTVVVKSDLGKEQALNMFQAALAKAPALRDVCRDAVTQARALIALVNDKLGGDAPDLRPLYSIANAVAGLLPPEAGDDEAAGDGEAGAHSGGGGGGAAARGLSGAVSSREEAIRAIDLVIAYLEQAEPTNPAPLFLRRARQLIGHNFLQLMKVLAPDSLAEVARFVGVDPESVEEPGAGS